LTHCKVNNLSSRKPRKIMSIGTYLFVASLSTCVITGGYLILEQV